MSRRLLLAANLTAATALAGWATFLLAHARTKLDYLKAQVHQSIPTCQPISPSDPRLASMGLSHEPSHSWTDRRRAYLVFSLPPMPKGGEFTINVIAAKKGTALLETATTRQHVPIAKANSYHLPLAAAPSAQIVTLTLASRHMAPPHGHDRRWLGMAIASIEACPH